MQTITDVNPFSLDDIYFILETNRIESHSVAKEAMRLRSQYPAGNLMQNGFFCANLNCMTGVSAALEARYQIG
ncbi:MAG: hypothetical protein BWX60_00763 [Candidatus Marinimicrobia bacterium ADurb.Bin030]|nr:MAG: hypothetical protein BWX60_00763 [Candidatus Marinimicrobia bacterium ADurb.Bin030]